MPTAHAAETIAPEVIAMPFSKAKAADAELGLDTFGDVSVGPDGELLHHAEVIRNVIEQGILADEVGVTVFGIGEHHRADYAISNPAVVLAAIASRTKNIKLTSSVTVLSADDPVRVWEKYATLNAISHGRAEVIVGKGSFSDTFPLFGLNLEDYDRLFSEKIDLWSLLLKESPITWSGTSRAPITETSVFPRTENGLRSWMAASGNPNSVMRAARYGIPLMLAAIAGDPKQFKSFVDLYHTANARFGHGHLPMGVHAPGFVARTDDEAHDIFMKHWIDASRAHAHNLIGRPVDVESINEERYFTEVREGSLFVGSPDTVATKIASLIEHLGLNRFVLKYTEGAVPHDALMDCIRLYGTEVMPRVRAILQETPE
ncbi:LLM class flavin-dependent oxidoreductase [Corynebacterium epidermidicanis]|uniref:LLM class flavin-dependent oxidoreductase n=1 Tax=Corynebacterium epidermidicanis TaxID=1050174 RepID=UPI001F40F89D|nr:LLM class flavin-dependent oxidoreductase [Corynebacterium epidermidicanis]